MSRVDFRCSFLSYVIEKYKVSVNDLWSARLCTFWAEEVGKCLLLLCACIICSSRLIVKNTKKQYTFSSYYLPVLSTLASFIVLPSILLPVPFMLLTSFLSFKFVPEAEVPILLVQGKQGQVISYSDRNCLYLLRKCENLFFICSWNRYFRNVLNGRDFFF